MKKIGVCLIVVGAVVTVICRPKSVNQDLPKKAFLVQVLTTRVAPPIEVQRDFWVKNLNEPIMNKLIGYKYPIPEIRERYSFLVQAVVKRFGKVYELSASPTYSDAGILVNFANKVENGTPIVYIVVPKMMDIFAELKASGAVAWREQFELNAVAGIIHELDHLAGDPGDAQVQAKTLDGLVSIEKRAWASTCRHVLVPLIEKYHKSLPPGTQSYYECWVDSGRNENSSFWEANIREAYSPTRPKK